VTSSHIGLARFSRFSEEKLMAAAVFPRDRTGIHVSALVLHSALNDKEKINPASIVVVIA